MSCKLVIEAFKLRQPIIYQIAFIDFEYSNEAICRCLLRQFKLTGGITFKCAGDLIAMLFDDLRYDREYKNDFACMKILLESLPSPSPSPTPTAIEHSQLKQETFHLWLEQFCLLCCQRNQKKESTAHNQRYNHRNALLMPCFHFTLCIACANTLTRCNICRIPIDNITKVFTA